MTARSTLTLVLLVSCAHAMVHIYELSFPGVEQQVAGDYFPGEEAAGNAGGDEDDGNDDCSIIKPYRWGSFVKGDV